MKVKSTPDKKKSAKKDNKTEITVGRNKVIISNREKIFWPSEKITKGDVIDYYLSMAEYILPYLKGRPESLKRNRKWHEYR